MIVLTLARKPLDGAVAANVQKHGCGGLNIDGTRIQTSEDFSGIEGFASMKTNTRKIGESIEAWKARAKSNPGQAAAAEKLQNLGRFPANLILTHLGGCCCVGSSKIKGTRTDTRPIGDGGRDDKSQWRFRPTDQTKRGYSDDAGLEIVDKWMCAEGCPVAALDDQSGIRPGMSGGGATIDNFKNKTGAEVIPSFNRKPSTPFIRSDTGGASRFFKQVQNESSD